MPYSSGISSPTLSQQSQCLELDYHDDFQSDYFQSIESFLQRLCVHANQLDRDPDALRQAFNRLGEAGILGIKGPKAWGGEQLPSSAFCRVQEIMARYSGALAFLQNQHQNAVSKLSDSTNEVLQGRYLSDAIQGQIGIGVAFSHLRRIAQPCMNAEPVSGGYRISGKTPWITGYRFFQFFILAATLPDQRVVLGLLPFDSIEQHYGGSIALSEPMQLASMTSTNTVQASLNQWFLPTENVIGFKDKNWIHQSDRLNILNHFFILGCARAGLDVVEKASHQPYASAQIRPTWMALDQRLNHCCQHIYHAQVQAEALGREGLEGKDIDKHVKHFVHLRAQAIDLAARCAHAAVIVSRGVANVLDHPAQRIYRESLAFSVFGQTTPVMEASLAQLVHSSIPIEDG